MSEVIYKPFDIKTFAISDRKTFDFNVENAPNWTKGKDNRIGYAAEELTIVYLETLWGVELTRIDESNEEVRGKGDFIAEHLIYEMKCSAIQRKPHTYSIAFDVPETDKQKQFFEEKDFLVCSYFNPETYEIIIWDIITMAVFNKYKSKKIRGDTGKWFWVWERNINYED
jgi:hypothetical protein